MISPELLEIINSVFPEQDRKVLLRSILSNEILHELLNDRESQDYFFLHKPSVEIFLPKNICQYFINRTSGITASDIIAQRDVNSEELVKKGIDAYQRLILQHNYLPSIEDAFYISCLFAQRYLEKTNENEFIKLINPEKFGSINKKYLGWICACLVDTCENTWDLFHLLIRSYPNREYVEAVVNGLIFNLLKDEDIENVSFHILNKQNIAVCNQYLEILRKKGMISSSIKIAQELIDSQVHFKINDENFQQTKNQLDLRSMGKAIDFVKNLGLLHFYAGKTSEATNLLNKVKELMSVHASMMDLLHKEMESSEVIVDQKGKEKHSKLSTDQFHEISKLDANVESWPIIPYTRINKLLQEKQYSEAEKIIEDFLNDGVSDPNLFLVSAEIHIQLGGYAHALNEINIAAAIDPLDIKIQKILARANFLLGRYKQAFEVFSNVLLQNKQPEYLDIEDYCQYALRSGQPHLVSPYIEKYIEKENISTSLILATAEAEFMLGDDEKALAYLQQIIIDQKEKPRPWILLSRVHEKNGNIDKSLEALFTGQKYSPQSQIILFELAKSHQKIGNLTLFHKYISEMIELPLESLELTLDISKLLVNSHQEDLLFKLLEQASEIWPKSQELIIEISKLHNQRRDHKLAAGLLEEVSIDFPLEYEGMKLFLLSLFKSSEDVFPLFAAFDENTENKIDNAITNLLTKSPDDSWANLFKAVFLLLQAEYTSAYDILSKHLSQSEKITEDMVWRYQLVLGQVMVEIGKPEAAIPLFQEISEKKPTLLEVNKYLANAFIALGLSEKAFEIAWHAFQHSVEGEGNILWLDDFLVKTEKTDSAIHLINQKIEKDAGTIRDLILLSFLELGKGNILTVKQLLNQLNFSEMNQFEIEQLFLLEMKIHDYSKAEPIISDPILVKGMSPRRVNLYKACLFFHQGKLLECEQVLRANIKEFDTSDLEQVILLEIISKKGDVEELRQFINEHACDGLLRKYGEISQANEYIKDNNDIFPDKWKTIIFDQKESASLIVDSLLIIGESQKAADFMDHLLSKTKFNFDFYELAAELARNQLLFEKAEYYIEIIKQKIKENENVTQNTISLNCLAIELLLEVGNELKAASLLNEILVGNEEDSRVLAVQARIFLRQFDAENAKKAYENAKNHLQEVEPWFLDAALEIGDHDGFITGFTNIFEENPNSPYLLCLLLREKAELAKLNYQFNELNSVKATDQLLIKNNEFTEKISIQIFEAEKFHPEIALWNSINLSLKKDEKPIIPIPQKVMHIASFIAFLYRINKNHEGLTNLLNTDQSNPELNFQMAMILIKENPELSREHFLNAIARNPNNPLYYAGLAYLDSSSGKAQEALEMIEQALVLEPGETNWRKLAVDAAESSSKWDSVIFHGKAVIASELIDDDIAKKVLKAYLQKGDYSSAGDLINKFKMDEDDSYEVTIALGRAALIQNNYKKLIDYANKGLKQKPDSPEPHILFCQMSLQLKAYEKAYEYALKATELKPDDCESLLALGSAIEHTKGIDAAIDYLNLAIAKGNKSPAIFLHIANLIRTKHGVESALQFLITYQEQPNEKILNQMAHFAFELGDDNQAERIVRESLSLIPNQSDIIRFLGNISEKRGHLDQAIKYYYDAISLNPAETENYISASDVLVQRRELLKAVEVLNSGIKMAGDDWKLYQQAGKIYWDGKDYRKAEEYFYNAHQLNPSDPRIKRQLDTISAMNILHTQQGVRI